MQSWSSPPNGNNPTTLLTYNFLFVRHKQIKHSKNNLFYFILYYNTIFLVECQDGNGLLFHFINFVQTRVIFYSRSTSKNLPFFALTVDGFHKYVPFVFIKRKPYTRCNGMGDLWSSGCGHCQRRCHPLWLYLGADRCTGGKGHQHRPDRQGLQELAGNV